MVLTLVKVHLYFRYYYFRDEDGNCYCWHTKNDKLKNVEMGGKIKVTSYKEDTTWILDGEKIIKIKNVRFKVLTD